MNLELSRRECIPCRELEASENFLCVKGFVVTDDRKCFIHRKRFACFVCFECVIFPFEMHSIFAFVFSKPRLVEV